MIEHKFKKKFGQNFLQDKNIIKKIASVPSINSDDLIIEIGPGSGALTEELVTKAQVLSYEIDNDLRETLISKFAGKNVEFIFDDFLNRDLKKDLSKYKYNNLYVIANLPYYITTPIINKIINEKLDVKQMILMVQKEVGERFASKPNTREYGSITVFLNYYFNIKQEFIVGRKCFNPAPNVDSMVISLNQKPERVKVDMKKFDRLVRDSFQFKRKNLRNNLKNYDLNLIEEMLKKYGFDLNSRAEQINYKIFIEIANEISEKE